MENEQIIKCNFCRDKDKKYTCPRCNSDYCSLICYQSKAHVECAESFFKTCVLNEMAVDNNDEVASKQKIMEALSREQEYHDCDDVSDSDDDDECPGLNERLANVNLNDTNEVWKRLTTDERQEFEAFIRSGDISKFVPEWQPWWSYRSDAKIEELETIDEYKKSCPKIKENIEEFSKITKKTPSENVKYNLINIVSAYAFIVRYFNGCHDEFCEEAVSELLHLSLCFKVNQNFNSANSAIVSVQQESTKIDWLKPSAENVAYLKEDVEKILNGPRASDTKFYVLCALSDLHQLVNSSLQKRVSGEKHNLFNRNSVLNLEKTKIKLCLKKIEYFLSYTTSYF